VYKEKLEWSRSATIDQSLICSGEACLLTIKRTFGHGRLALQHVIFCKMTRSTRFIVVSRGQDCDFIFIPQKLAMKSLEAGFLERLAENTETP
jgi:hypothetical protein